MDACDSAFFKKLPINYLEPVPNLLISVVCTTHSPFSADTQLADCIKTEHSCVFFSLTPYGGRNSPVRFFLRSFFVFLCSLLLLLILLVRLRQPGDHPKVV